jgi:hypothetical protein
MAAVAWHWFGRWTRIQVSHLFTYLGRYTIISLRNLYLVQLSVRLLFLSLLLRHFALVPKAMYIQMMVNKLTSTYLLQSGQAKSNKLQ